MRNPLNSVWRFLKKAWGLLGLLGFFTTMHFVGKDFNRTMRQEHRFTVGVVYGTHWTLKSGKFADARFFVAGQKYLADADADELAGQPLVGRRFLVKFHSADPSYYKVLYLTVPVPDGVDAPAEGWETPPFAVPAEVLAAHD